MSCVSDFLLESLFLPLSFYLPCLDMFLSPSPKFPSFRERSEVRDSDLPRGWVKDSLPPSPSWEMCCTPPPLYFVYTWVPYPPLDHLTMCRKTPGIQFPPLFWIVQQDQCVQLCGVIVWAKTKEKKPQLYALKSDFDSMRWMALV